VFFCFDGSWSFRHHEDLPSANSPLQFYQTPLPFTPQERTTLRGELSGGETSCLADGFVGFRLHHSQQSHAIFSLVVCLRPKLHNLI